MSRPTVVQVHSLRRPVHCMSQPEVRALLLALHHPDLVDIHEQKMLHPWPANHPLLGFPGYTDGTLQPVRGTLDVAERLNCRRQHPRLMVEDPQTGERAPVLFPYQGDFLLFIRAGDKIRLINWPVKKRPEDFHKPEAASSKAWTAARQKLQRRLMLESIYYQDIDVPTVPVAADAIDNAVFNNLKTAFSYAQRNTTLSATQQSAILSVYQSAVADRLRPNEVLADLNLDGLCTIEDGRTVFYASIWRRQLRLDLFSNVIFDAPLRPERQDVFEHYAALFPGCRASDLKQGAAA